MTSSQIKDFYERVDRTRDYTIEVAAADHPFYPILQGFLGRRHLKDKRCLEIGSAKGLFQDLVDDYTGVDIAESLRPYYRKPYITVKDERLPFSDDSFDGIFTYATHEHIPELETALTEIVRVLKPGGVCLFAPAWHTRPWFAQGYAVRPYSELAMREKMIKLSIPFRDLIIFRWTFVLIRRTFRLLLYAFSSQREPLRYRKLKANYDKFWQSDSDACNSLDPFDVILWFRNRGMECIGFENLLKSLFVRVHSIEVRKPSR